MDNFCDDSHNSEKISVDIVSFDTSVALSPENEINTYVSLQLKQAGVESGIDYEDD